MPHSLSIKTPSRFPTTRHDKGDFFDDSTSVRKACLLPKTFPQEDPTFFLSPSTFLHNTFLPTHEMSVDLVGDSPG